MTDEAELAGLPASAQAAARQMAELKGKEGGCSPWTSPPTCR